MVMMNDEQRANDVLAGADVPAASSAADGPAAAAAGADPRAPGPDAAEAEDQDGDETADEPKSRWSFLTEMVVLFAVALTIALLIKTFIVQPFFIPSASMEDTLLVGDKVLVNKIVYRIRPISRGDIVVFNGAGSWQPPERSSPPSHNPLVRFYDATLGALFKAIRGLFGTQSGQTDYIKRVIGIPGDHVVCCNARGRSRSTGSRCTRARTSSRAPNHRTGRSTSSCRPASSGSWATTGRSRRTPACTIARTRTRRPSACNTTAAGPFP